MTARRRGLALASALICGAGLLSACGGSTATADGNSATVVASVAIPDPCTLLAAEQIATIIGVDPGKGTGSATGTTCTYPVGLELGADQAGSYAQVATGLRSNASILSVTPLAGLGDEAQVVRAKDGTVLVMTRKGAFAVFATGPGTPEQLTAIDQALLAALHAG